MAMKIAIVGAGAWGTALAISAAGVAGRSAPAHRVTLWARDAAQLTALQAQSPADEEGSALSALDRVGSGGRWGRSGLGGLGDPLAVVVDDRAAILRGGGAAFVWVTHSGVLFMGSGRTRLGP